MWVGYGNTHAWIMWMSTSNLSQCTSTTDSQELALNCTVHKIFFFHCVYCINQLIPIIIWQLLELPVKAFCILWVWLADQCERTIDLNRPFKTQSQWCVNGKFQMSINQDGRICWHKIYCQISSFFKPNSYLIAFFYRFIACPFFEVMSVKL